MFILILCVCMVWNACGQGILITYYCKTKYIWMSCTISETHAVNAKHNRAYVTRNAKKKQCVVLEV